MIIVSKSAMMDTVRRGVARESFEHEELGCFDVTAMREYAAKNGELIDVDLRSVVEFIKAGNRIFEQARVDALPDDSWQLDPILYICLKGVPPEPTTYLLIDGTHRALRRHQEGLDTVSAFILHEKDIIRPDLSKFGDTRDLFELDWGAPVPNRKKGS